jgi:hypothetical protein
MNNQGWIKLHRKIFENKYWLLEPFTKAQAWIDLLLLANHKEGEILIRGNFVKVNRGQVGWSERSLSKRWRWSRMKVRRFLDDLKTRQQIRPQKNNITTLIDIINYKVYQSDETTNETTERPQKDHRRDHNKNDKNDKNILSKDNTTYGNSEINYILSSYKKWLGTIPTDRKPRQVAQHIRQITHTFIKTIAPYRKYEFNELIDKSFKWYMERDQIKGETLDVVKRKMKMLFDVTLEKAKGGVKHDKQI